MNRYLRSSLAKTLKVCLVRGVESGRIKNYERMEKWESRKDFIFSLFYLVRSRKVKGMEKMSLNKFTHIPLLKNDAKLKKKKKFDKLTTQKRAITQIFL